MTGPAKRVPFECLWCEELVVPGDLMHSLLPGYHYACAMRAVHGPIAHCEQKCSCYVKDSTAEHDPPELTKRQAARIVAAYVNAQPGRN